MLVTYSTHFFSLLFSLSQHSESIFMLVVIFTPLNLFVKSVVFFPLLFLNILYALSAYFNFFLSSFTFNWSIFLSLIFFLYISYFHSSFLNNLFFPVFVFFSIILIPYSFYLITCCHLFYYPLSQLHMLALLNKY